MLFSLTRKQARRAAVLIAGQAGPYKDETPAFVVLPTQAEYAAGVRLAEIISEHGHLLAKIPSTEAFKL